MNGINSHTQNHLMALVWDYPGEPVQEETFIHSCGANSDRLGRWVYSSDNSIYPYWHHFATQTDSCQLLAHMCPVGLKLHWLNLVSTCFTNKFAINP